MCHWRTHPNLLLDYKIWETQKVEGGTLFQLLILLKQRLKNGGCLPAVFLMMICVAVLVLRMICSLWHEWATYVRVLQAIGDTGGLMVFVKDKPTLPLWLQRCAVQYSRVKITRAGGCLWTIMHTRLTYFGGPLARSVIYHCFIRVGPCNYFTGRELELWDGNLPKANRWSP